MSKARPPCIAITTGEPAGIGPQVSLIAAAARVAGDARLVLIGDLRLLAERAQRLGVGLTLVNYTGSSAPPGPRLIEVIDVPLAVSAQAGHLDARNARAVLSMLDCAIDGTTRGEFAAMVTAPLQKSVINEAGIAFTGHTEYLAERTGVEHVVMMLAGGGLRVALASTHLPLAAVPHAITRLSLRASLRILNQALIDSFAIEAPRILVCGLNPHAGEGGYLGREEIDVIGPAIDEARAHGIDARGPLPADTLFQPKYLEDCDAVLAMYHDQGLPVLKYASFGHGVNVTLGLPIVRTSVDHGTALDLAHSGPVDAGSMSSAIDMALAMVRHRASREARRA